MSVAVTEADGKWRAPRAAAPKLWFNPLDPNTPHLRFAIVSILVLWLFVLSGLQALPKQYVSRATLIIPGATTAVNVALDKIGQASTAPVSAYNTGHISPKVVYKEMAQSDEVRGEAARRLGIPLSAFIAPRIKLVDETPLVHIEMRHRDPETTWRHGVALIEALQRHLDRLRADELERRSEVVRASLVDYEKSLETARAAILAHQAATGLQSTGQYNELSAALIQRGRRHAELEAEVARLETEQATLMSRLGVTPVMAARALKAVADPTLTKWLGDYADSTAALTAEMHRLGEENPQLLNLRKRRDAAAEHLRVAAAERGLDDGSSLQVLVLLSNSSHQADLFRRLVANEAALDGKRVERNATLK
jgi:hypothetical protein